MIRTALLLVLTSPTPLVAESAGDWLSSGLQMPARTVQAGQWHPLGGEIYATDPLTLAGAFGPTITVPDAPADIMGYLAPQDGRTALMALIWSDAPVVCGADLATIGVDTGLAGFITPSDVAALDAYAHPDYGTYHGTYAAQLDERAPTIPFIAALPDGARFPVAGSGWGDGGYPVASLHDALGNMVALYAQFITAEGQDWLLPPPCAPASS